MIIRLCSLVRAFNRQSLLGKFENSEIWPMGGSRYVNEHYKLWVLNTNNYTLLYFMKIFIGLKYAKRPEGIIDNMIEV